MTPMLPEDLKHSWTALVELNGGHRIEIWWTCWPSIKRHVKEVIWIASDYPQQVIPDDRFIIT